MARAGRVGDPQVFAELGGNNQVGHALAGKQQVGSHWNLFTVENLAAHIASANREVARFVELVVGGQVHLRDEAQHVATGKRSGNVQELARMAKRQANEDKRIHRSRFRGYLRKGFLGFVEQLCLPEQVAAGVGGDAQLGQNHNLGMGGFHLADAGNDLLRVCLAVGNRYLRGGGCHRYKSVPHARSLRSQNRFPRLYGSSARGPL